MSSTAKKPDADDFRHIPYDIDVEQAVLGAIIVDNSAMERVSDNFASATFYDPLHQRLYQCMTKLQRAGTVVNPLTIHAQLKTDPGLIEVGGIAYLANLAAAAPAIPNMHAYCAVLLELHTRRELIRICEDVVNRAYEPPANGSAIEQLERAETAIFRLGTRARSTRSIIDGGQSGREVLAIAESALRGEPVPAIPLGLDQFDEACGGLHPSDLILACGRPGMGKSIVLETAVLNAARRGYPALLFGLEMGHKQYSQRILCDIDFDSEEARTRALWYENLRRGKITESEMRRLVMAQGIYDGLPIEICDDTGLTINDMRAIAKRFASKHGAKLGLIAIDYLQKTKATSTYQGKRVDELAEISEGAKDLAKELEWPVLAGVQLSREIERRPEKERLPTLSDIRACGEIEEDADVIIGLRWRGYYVRNRRPPEGPSSPDWPAFQADWIMSRHSYDLLGLKNRHGSTDALTCNVWCEMGAAALRSREPFDQQTQDLVSMAEAAR